MDLWNLLQALSHVAPWKINRDGTLARSTLNKLRKLVPGSATDPLTPPVVELLHYEILRGVGAVCHDYTDGTVCLPAAEKHLRRPACEQAWYHVRVWLCATRWQDGIGMVKDILQPERWGSDAHGSFIAARELLAWGLCRVAHGAGDWIDLESFLINLWSIQGDETVKAHGGSYSWKPTLSSAGDRVKMESGPQRMLAFWLEYTGIWAANALLGTLTDLGLIERGSTGSDKQARYCFRLTPVGRSVFGAPELPLAEPAHDPRFFTVQPNHEVVAYLKDADPAAAWQLVRMTRRVSSASGHVQTFALTRDSVYHALETGSTLEGMQQFLTRHSKTGLANNVARSLEEWCRHREALVLHTDVSLALFPSGSDNPFAGAHKHGIAGDRFMVVSGSALQTLPMSPRVVNHANPPEHTWRIDEEGRVHFTGVPDVLSLARLTQFADPHQQCRKITSASVRRARDQGIQADQILGWLAMHVDGDVPPLIQIAIGNWSKPAHVFLGDLLLLQVSQTEIAETIRSSTRLQPFLLGHIAPTGSSSSRRSGGSWKKCSMSWGLR